MDGNDGTTTGDAVAPRRELPKRLSPSRISDFKKCPLAFYFKSVERVPTQPTEPQIKGTLVHSVLERLFELPRHERTPAAALGFLPGEWSELRSKDEYAELVASLDEESFLGDATRLVENYFSMEDPTAFDPAGCEMWVRGNVEDQDLIGVIDRLDRVQQSNGDTAVFISDYKTGKVPKPRFRDEAFFAMRMYALMRHQDGERVDRLRLVYLKEGTRDAVLRFDVDDAVLAATEAEVGRIVRDIRSCHEADRWPTKVGPLCNWCDYQHMCPEFADEASVVADRSERVRFW